MLRGQRLVPLQIQYEWIEYQLLFNDILTRFGSQLARQAKSEKKRVKAQLQDQHPEPSPQLELSPMHHSDLSAHKSELRRRVAQSRGLTLNGSAPPQSLEEKAP